MQPNEEFISQKEDVEKLKKERAAKKTGTSKEEGTLTIVKDDFIGTELKKFDIAESVVEKWKEEYLALKITDVNDKEQMIKVTDAHRLVKNTRVSIEKKRKELKEDSLRFGRAIDNEAKRLTALVEPIEEYLESQKNIVEIEKEKIRLEKENAMKVRMQARTTTLLSFGAVFNGEVFTLQEGEEKLEFNALDIKMSDDTAFNIMSLKMEILSEKCKIRIAEEQRLAQEERARVETIAKAQEEERLRLEALAAEQAKKVAEIEAQQRVIEEQKKEMERQAQKAIEIKAAEEAARIKAEKEKEEALAAAEQKRLDDIARLEKAAADKIIADKKAEEDRIAKEKEAKLKAEKEAALRPDKEKLLAFAEDMSKTDFYLPKLSTEEGIKIMETVLQQHLAYVKWIKAQADKLGIK